MLVVTQTYFVRGNLCKVSLACSCKYMHSHRQKFKQADSKGVITIRDTTNCRDTSSRYTSNIRDVRSCRDPAAAVIPSSVETPATVGISATI